MLESFQSALPWLSPLGLELAFLLLVASALLSYRAIRDSLPPHRYLPWLVGLVALVSVKALPPSTHRIYYDEDIYQNVAQNILMLSRAQMCNEGILDGGEFLCRASEYNKEPNAFPFLLSLAFRVSGVEEDAAHWLNHFLFALGAMAVYWLAGMLFERASVALAAALVYTLTPQNLLWGATVAAEPGAASFAVVGVGASVLFCRCPSRVTAVFGASALAFAGQFRPESVLILAVGAASLLLVAPRPFPRRQSVLALCLLVVLLAPHFIHLVSVRHESWGSASGAKFALEHVLPNAKTNLGYHVSGKDFPRYFTPLALLGLAYPRRRRETGILSIWFVLLFGVFLPFYAGSYRYGADVRFSLVSAAPFAILAGAGAGWLGEILHRRLGRRSAEAVPLVLVLYAFTAFLPLVRATGSEAWASRADHEMAEAMLAELPDNSIVLTHNPGMIQVMGQSAAQTSTATYDPARVDGFFRQFHGGVYFHYNFWCNVNDPVQNDFCTEILERYATRVVLEKSVRFYRYVLYRLLPRSVPPPPLR